MADTNHYNKAKSLLSSGSKRKKKKKKLKNLKNIPERWVFDLPRNFQELYQSHPDLLIKRLELFRDKDFTVMGFDMRSEDNLYPVASMLLYDLNYIVGSRMLREQYQESIKNNKVI